MSTAPSYPRLTFVIPAYNASKTLHVALDSVRAQTRSDWQAVIVDDGSIDNTYEIATAYARRDPRIKVVQQENAGVATARNTGVAAADAAYICLLDSDDWIDRTFMARMLKPLADLPGGFVSYCTYRRVINGRYLPVEHIPDLTGDKARQVFSVHCALAIHCAVFARTDYEKIGGMNTALKTSEDWELWLRLAFQGIEFLRVPQCLSFYNQHVGSLSRDIRRMSGDSLSVARLSETLNAREVVPYAPAGLAASMCIAWWLPQEAITGADCAYLLDLADPLPDLSDHVDQITEAMAHALFLSAQIEGKDLQKAYDSWAPAVDRLFHAMEIRAYAGFANQLWIHLLKRIVRLALPEEMWVAGNICAFSIEVDAKPDIPKPASADTMVVAFTHKGKVRGIYVGPMFGHFQLPSMDEAISYLPRTALLKQRSHPFVLLRLVMQLIIAFVKQARSLYSLVRAPGARREKLKARLISTMRRLLPPVHTLSAFPKDSLAVAESLVNGMRASAATQPSLPEATDMPVDRFTGDIQVESREFWESVFESADPWDYFSPYEQTKYRQTLESICRAPAEKAMEVACAEGIFTHMIAGHVGHLRAVDISERALERARQRCKDLTNIDYGVFNLIDDAMPSGLDLIVCSEVLYYVGADKLKGIAEKYAGALNDKGRIVMAHPHTVDDAPNRTGFDWSGAYGVDTIRKAFAAIPGLALEHSIETELYAIDTFRKTDHPEAVPTEIVEAAFDMPETKVLRSVIWDGVIKRRDEALRSETVHQVPVLMYHRIAEDGPEALAPWRVTPADFEAQLRLLRRHGYYSISSETLATHIQERRPLPGRPVLITFDDAYQDFADAAFPVLDRNDFSAEVFVVTDKVGQSSDWDAAYGLPAPLMDWPEIERLHKLGIRFGSHMASHTPAPALSSAKLLDEAIGSKLDLETRLGAPVTAIAMPYGRYDARVEPVLSLCGYTLGFSTAHGFAGLYDNPLCLPRLDVQGGMSLEAFVQLLNLKP